MWTSSPYTIAHTNNRQKADLHVSRIEPESPPGHYRSIHTQPPPQSIDIRMNMPLSQRTTRQTSTTNLDQNFILPADPKQPKRGSKEKQDKRRDLENNLSNLEKENSQLTYHDIPPSPSPSNESLPNTGAIQAKKKDEVEWLNKIGSMIKINSEDMAARIDKKLDDNAKIIAKNIKDLEKKHSQKLKDMGEELKEYGKEINKIKSLPEDVAQLNTRIDGLEAKSAAQNETQNQLINVNSQKTSDLERKLASPTTNPTLIAPIGSQLDEVDQRRRNYSLLINGLYQQHQTREGVLNFAREVLKINNQPIEIDEVANMGLNKAQQTSTRVTFTSLTSRMRYFKARGNLKGSGLTVWINEDLSKAREILAHNVRLKLKGNGIYKTWTNMGLIYAKTSEEGTPVRIASDRDIEELINSGSLQPTPRGASLPNPARNNGSIYAAQRT